MTRQRSTNTKDHPRNPRAAAAVASAQWLDRAWVTAGWLAAAAALAAAVAALLVVTAACSYRPNPHDGDVGASDLSERSPDAHIPQPDPADPPSDDALEPPEDAADVPVVDQQPLQRITLGGGRAYVDELRARGEPTFCDASKADHLVKTRGELQAALLAATATEVVYVDPAASIDLTGPNAWGKPVGVVKAGVTLASNRGCPDPGGQAAEGAQIFTRAINEPLLGARQGARVTGLRISGPFFDWTTTDHTAGDGVLVQGADMEVDNCEIWGFSYAGVHAGLRTHVHHSFIHHNPKHGLGYGVAGGDQVLIEHNHFRNNRHSIASSGRNSYTARYNLVDGEAISHIFDMHLEGGKTIIIHHNTITPVQQVDDPKKAPAVTIRGIPSDRAEIHHNWLHNPEKPCTSNKGESWEDCAIHQRWVDSFQNVSFHDNHYGNAAPPSCDIGAPRPGCPLP